MSTSYQWGIAVGVIVGILIVAAIFTYNKKKTGTINGGDFDERQQLLRGKAFQKGFFTMMGFSGLYWVLVAADSAAAPDGGRAERYRVPVRGRRGVRHGLHSARRFLHRAQ